MAVSYTTTAELAKVQGIKIAIYGNAKTGKTALAATAPKPFIVAIEPGLIVLKRQNIVRMHGEGTPGINYREIQVANVTDCRDLRALHTSFERGDEWTKAYETIFIDSLSQLAENELKYQMTQTPNGQKAYGEMADEVLACIRLFTELPKFHVVFTAKQAYSQAAGLLSASFPGQLLDFHFPFEFDCILQTVVGDLPGGGINRFLRVTSDLKNFAGDRTGALNPAGELPYLYNIFAKISAD